MKWWLWLLVIAGFLIAVIAFLIFYYRPTFELVR